jgi:glycolate oxidase iron-sulfur subunit
MQIQLADRYRDTPLGEQAQRLMSPCVQCGQCTFVCPTFRLLDDEWDGPRGRIYLIKHLLEGTTPVPDQLPPAYSMATLEGRTLAANLQLHLDRCLTCRSCEAACPEGVRFGRLLDIGRELVEQVQRRPIRERVWRWTLRSTLPKKERFTSVLRTGQLLRDRLPRRLRNWVPERRADLPWPSAVHPRTMVLWQGCVQPALAPAINAAAARVMGRLGVSLIPAPDGCCGALSQHMSAMDEARQHMRRNVDALWPMVESGAEALVITASGCGALFRDYGELLGDDPAYRDKARRLADMTRDIAEVVAEGWRDDSAPALGHLPPGPRIAYQSSCSLQHAQKLNGVVERLLKRAGFRLVPVDYPFMCCGSAGAYRLLQNDISQSLRALKLKSLMTCRPHAIATANIGCLTHLADTAPVPVNHWIELLDARFSAAEKASNTAVERTLAPGSTLHCNV